LFYIAILSEKRLVLLQVYFRHRRRPLLIESGPIWLRLDDLPGFGRQVVSFSSVYHMATHSEFVPLIAASIVVTWPLLLFNVLALPFP